MTLEFSQSEVGTFLSCKRQFLYNVLMKLSPAYEGVAPFPCTTAAKGTLYHASLAHYYRGKYPELPSYEEVREVVYREALRISGCGEAEIPLNADWMEAVELATIMAHSYIPWVEGAGHDIRYETLMVEERLSSEYGGVIIHGQIDLAQRDELIGEHQIVDHKTVANFTQTPRPGNFQLLTYASLYRRHTGITPQAAFHNRAKRNKHTARAQPPFYDRVPITISDALLDQHDMMLHHIGQQIVEFAADNHGNALPNFTGECDWKCPVKELCDTLHDPDFDHQWFIEDRYRVRTKEYYDNDND